MSSTPNKNAELLLDSLEREFTEWRKQKRYPREPIPKSLLEKACAISLQLNDTVVRNRLGISQGQLRRCAGDATQRDKPPQTQASPPFAEVASTSIESITLNPPPKELTIEIRLPSGTTIALSNLPSNTSPLAMIGQLIGEPTQC